MTIAAGRTARLYQRNGSVSSSVTSDYNHAVTEWMRHDFKPPTRSEPARQEVVSFVMVKDSRSMVGVLRRVDEERWEARYLVDGALYMSQMGESEDAGRSKP